jgi:hypothetical protein
LNNYDRLNNLANLKIIKAFGSYANNDGVTGVAIDDDENIPACPPPDEDAGPVISLLPKIRGHNDL